MLAKQILLVEDDLNLGVLVLDFLTSEGYHVVWKRDGLGALQQLRRQRFDLCILDVGMPGMDGFSLAKNIRELNARIQETNWTIEL